MAKTLIGFDVSTNDAIVSQTKGIAHYEQMPGNLLDEGEIISPNTFAAFLKGLKKNAGASGNDVAVVLPERATYYLTYNCPVMSEEQIKLNLPFEFRNFVGPETGKYNYDFIVDSVENDESGKAKTLNLIAAAGQKEVIEQYESVFKKAGLNLKLALPKEICLINLMKKQAVEDKEYCLIGVGYEYTNVYMFKGSKLEATKAIDIGNKDIDNAISLELNVDIYDAAKYREANKEECLENKHVVKVYERIGLEVMKTINFYKYEHNESTLETAHFFDVGSGNAALIKTICKQISFEKGDINDLLPKEFKNHSDAGKCLVNIGLVL